MVRGVHGRAPGPDMTTYHVTDGIVYIGGERVGRVWRTGAWWHWAPMVVAGPGDSYPTRADAVAALCAYVRAKPTG